MRALVTGGAGFLGRRIVEMLLEDGWHVRSLARGLYPELDALGVDSRQVDLCDAEAVATAIEGVDVVFHVAAKFGFSQDRASFYAINVGGTENVIAGMKKHGVMRLVYTGTPSVVGYKTDQEGIATAPYAETFEALYGETKAAAEKLVLAANGTEVAGGGRLATVALRPHLIFGPGDLKLIPTAIERARSGRMPIVGDGKNRVDLTYIDNAAGSHLDAANALTDDTAPCAGKAYFISNDEPVVLWEWLNDFLVRVEVPPIRRKISLALASRIGGFLEWIWKTFRLSGEPRMTRFMAAALARSHWYDMTPAKRDFGYRIRVDMTEATERTVAWVRRH